jgi:hypothetical protein
MVIVTGRYESTMNNRFDFTAAAARGGLNFVRNGHILHE